MALILNPDYSSFKYAVFIFDKNLFVTQDGQIPLTGNLENMLQHISGNKVRSIIAEPEYDYVAIQLAGDASEELSQFNLKQIMLREFYAVHSEEESVIPSRARAISLWHNSMRYCPSCGTGLLPDSHFTAKKCPSCKIQHFPRIEPCIIVLVHKGDQVLLVRHKQRNQDIYACIAGFIEVGESVEQAVKREVLEEAGLKIKNIRFKGTQSWPFPDQLMLAFNADYESGEIKIQEEEISEAKWFNKTEIPAAPKEGSVAYRLIYGDFAE